MSNRDEEEERAEAWLRAQGYDPKRPTWLPPGRNPDFLAAAADLSPGHIWVEVKSTEQDDSTAAMSKFHALIRSTEAVLPSGFGGSASLNIAPTAIEQSLRWALKELLKQLPKYAGQKVRLAFLQQTPLGTGVRRFDIEGDEPVVVWVKGAGDRKPLSPSSVYDDPGARLKTRVEGKEVTGPVYDFFDWTNDKFECALVARLDPSFLPFNRISPFAVGSSQVRERTVRALEDANGQLKTACAVEPAPGLVVLAPRSPLADADVQMEQAAIYGQFVVRLKLLPDGGAEQGPLEHGHDGAFRPDKNRHISAAIHLTREGPPIFFPNPFAHHRIPDDAPIFSGARRADVEFV